MVTNKKLIRIESVINKTGLAKSTVWAWVKENRMPAPIKLSARVTVWNESELDEWIDLQMQGGRK
jgi:prophage regulatory protein